MTPDCAIASNWAGARGDRIFSRLFDADIIGILFADTEGRITRANDRFLRMLGYQRGDQPLRWDDLMPPDWQPMNQTKSRDYFYTGIAGPLEKEYMHQDGHRVPILLWLALLEGSETQLVGFVVDCSESAKQQRQIRQLAASIAETEEAERRRIAEGIHDEVCQNLAVARIKLGNLERLDLGADTSQSHTEILALLDRSIQSCRELTFNLASPVLYELGLGAALQDLLDRVEKDHRICCEFESEGLLDNTNNELSGVLFRIVRELIHNVVKHARASALRVRLQSSDDQIRIAVADDGVGFDAGTGPDKLWGLGLLSIRQRLRQLGGCLEIDSAPGAGTRVKIIVPREVLPAQLGPPA